ncbi:hypothetical protein HUJ04_007726 [Dendroctonus ponderosae]|nr:hypothetical protein HUJ04_007726 [Dendroctonus ponderosae]
MMCNLSHNISPLFHPLRYGRANVKIWAKEYSNGVKILSKVGLNGSTFSTENDLIDFSEVIIFKTLEPIERKPAINASFEKYAVLIISFPDFNPFPYFNSALKDLFVFFANETTSGETFPNYIKTQRNEMLDPAHLDDETRSKNCSKIYLVTICAIYASTGN